MSSHFRFAADILRRLGEELNPGNDQSLLELVKNSYDADAVTCRITLHGTDHVGGRIEIVDDGVGMTSADLRDGWLVLGQSRKVTDSTTELGRHPAGSKGLGRLAALRMGTVAKVSTRPKSNPKMLYRLDIDWKKFERVSLVDEVALPITRSRGKSGKQGTTIVLDKLRDKLSKNDVKSLARSLILLADPFGSDPSGFQPTLIAPEFAEYEKLVKERYFHDADFHLVAGVDRKGRATAKVVDYLGKVLFKASHNDIAINRSGKPYACPPAKFDAWIFLISSQTFLGRRTVLRDVRTWLGYFGGVHIYQNGIRVAPYGNPGDDWLGINLRRVANPEERPGTNTMIARLSVSDPTGSLQQKTDRSGFIESVAFRDLRDFAHDCMEWIANRRLEIAERRRTKEKQDQSTAVSDARRTIDEAIENAPESAKQPLRNAFQNYQKEQDRETQNLKREVQLYRTLSTTGITAATFSHESAGSPMKIITTSINAIERRGKKELQGRYAAVLEQPVESIIRATATLGVLSSTTLSLIQNDKRRLRRVEVHRVIHNVYDLYQPFFEGRSVLCELNLFDGNPWMRASEAAIESVITNLLNNSLSAFEFSTKARKIMIRTSTLADSLTLSVSDSGPGITGVSLRDIWLPGVTTRPNGTGLGLTIVRDTVHDLGGKVWATEKSTLGGAEVLVSLPIIGS